MTQTCAGYIYGNSLYRCVLQGCILSSHARIEDKVTLKDCQVGTNFTVTKEGMLINTFLIIIITKLIMLQLILKERL